jgi:hypothetical protein
MHLYLRKCVLVHEMLRVLDIIEIEQIVYSFAHPKVTTTAQNKESNQKGHSFDVRRSHRHIPAYTRERAAAMFLGSIV